jgi:hypothetical protein
MEKADVILDGVNEIEDCDSILFPDSFASTNGDEDRSVEIDDSEKSVVGSEKSGILTDSMKCINIREEGIVGVKADDVGKISVLPVGDCRTRNNLSFLFCEEPVLCFEDENGSVEDFLCSRRM